jgi:hypothetical protein
VQRRHPLVTLTKWDIILNIIIPVGHEATASQLTDGIIRKYSFCTRVTQEVKISATIKQTKILNLNISIACFKVCDSFGGFGPERY